MIQPICIVGIDPGVSTGVAIATLWDSDKGEFTTEYAFSSTTCTEPEQVWAHITRPPVDVVVLERFGAQIISKYGLHTVRIIGGVQALCNYHGIRLIENTPTQRKAHMERARQLVTRDTTVSAHDERHEIDAMAHVVRYLRSLHLEKV